MHQHDHEKNATVTSVEAAATTPASDATEQRSGESAPRHLKRATTSYRPPIDLHELPDRYELHVDLPGTSRDLIDVTVHDSILTVEAAVPLRRHDDSRDSGSGPVSAIHHEFGIGDFRRSIRIGEDIDVDRLTASFEDGVLRVALPKRAERQPRRIEIGST